MKISRQHFDKLPFAIRTGALVLWGVKLASYSRSGRFCQLYSFNDFFAEVIYQEHKMAAVCTFPTITHLKPYLNGNAEMNHS